MFARSSPNAGALMTYSHASAGRHSFMWTSSRAHVSAASAGSSQSTLNSTGSRRAVIGRACRRYSVPPAKAHSTSTGPARSASRAIASSATSRTWSSVSAGRSPVTVRFTIASPDFRSAYVSGVTVPDAMASPLPMHASTTTTSRSPATGSAEKAIAAASAGTISWTRTPMRARSAIPCSLR